MTELIVLYLIGLYYPEARAFPSPRWAEAVMSRSRRAFGTVGEVVGTVGVLLSILAFVVFPIALIYATLLIIF